MFVGCNTFVFFFCCAHKNIFQEAVEFLCQREEEEVFYCLSQEKQALTMHSKGVITVQLHFIQGFGL